jgi:tetratricopeptide (TPR) repeat protein
MFLQHAHSQPYRRFTDSIMVGAPHGTLQSLQHPTKRQRGTLGFDVLERHARLDENDDDDATMEEDVEPTLFPVIDTNKKNTAASSSSSFIHPGSSLEEEEVSADDPFFPIPELTWENSPLSSRSSNREKQQFSSLVFSSSPLAAAAATVGGGGTFTTTTARSPTTPRVNSRENSSISFVLPAWFPWIPTKSQIESLKLVELKEACTQRGLVKSGKKADLQARLWKWTAEQQRQHHARLTGDYLTSWFENVSRQNVLPLSKQQQPNDRTSNVNNPFAGSNTFWATERSSTASPITSTAPNSLEEWSRTVDPERLTNKRKEIHRQKRQGKKPDNQHSSTKASIMSDTQDYLSKLTKAMQASPSSPYASNKEVKEIYKASKQADQLGERALSIELLESLLTITPQDARVYRRLARMYSEQGDVDVARATLRKGLKQLPHNPWLWHGMGQLEMNHGNTELGIRCYHRAIKEDPTFAHSYHAWGIHEYSQGQIANAMKILKKGIEYCPTNHRLHHALGDLYRGAKLLRDAERSYRRALQEGPPISHSFAYSALACVAYEQGDLEEARRWLYRSINLNNGRHAQGWLELAEMEEAEGNPDKALAVCQASIMKYEKGLIESQQRYKKDRENDRKRLDGDRSRIKGSRNPHQGKESSVERSGSFSHPSNPEEFKLLLLKSIPSHRSGDKFFKVYRHWTKLEERYGTFESADQAHERASLVFASNHHVWLDWAEYNAKLRNDSRARSLFAEACNQAGSSHADPYRQFAVFEMSRGNYAQARNILFRGAQALSQSSDGGLGNGRGLAQLYVAWAVAEWRLENISRTEVLFDHALRLTEAGEGGAEMRSYILHAMAFLEYQERGNFYLAQHCIGLCLKENRYPGGNAQVWKLWADIAHDMGSERLEENCLDEAEKCKAQKKDPASSSEEILKAFQMESRMRRDPWHDKLQEVRGMRIDSFTSDDKFYSSLRLPGLSRYRNKGGGTEEIESLEDAFELDEIAERAFDESL